MTLDFLEASRQDIPAPNLTPYEFNVIQLLKGITLELRRAHPLIKLTTVASPVSLAGGITSRIKFQTEGKDVKAQYIILGNGMSTTGMYVAINEPMGYNAQAAVVVSNGILLPIGQRQEIRGEVEYIEVALDNATSTKIASIGNPSGPNSAALIGNANYQGVFNVYAWGLPEQMYMGGAF